MLEIYICLGCGVHKVWENSLDRGLRIAMYYDFCPPCDDEYERELRARLLGPLGP